jgi:hypothetical protein
VDEARLVADEAKALATLVLPAKPHFRAYLKADPIVVTSIGDDRYDRRRENSLDPVKRAEYQAKATGNSSRARILLFLRNSGILPVRAIHRLFHTIKEKQRCRCFFQFASIARGAMS